MVNMKGEIVMLLESRDILRISQIELHSGTNLLFYFSLNLFLSSASDIAMTPNYDTPPGCEGPCSTDEADPETSPVCRRFGLGSSSKAEPGTSYPPRI